MSAESLQRAKELLEDAGYEVREPGAAVTAPLAALREEMLWPIDNHSAYHHFARSGEEKFIAFYAKVKELFARAEAAERERDEKAAVIEQHHEASLWLEQERRQLRDQRDALQARVAALEAGLRQLRDGVPRWHEVDQGGEIFGWKMPDENGRCIVTPAPRHVEHFTAALLAAAAPPEGKL